MAQDPTDRMVTPGTRLPPDVAAGGDVSEADVIEQALPLADEDTGAPYADPIPVDANPDDVLEQRLEVPVDDDDYPAT